MAIDAERSLTLMSLAPSSATNEMDQLSPSRKHKRNRSASPVETVVARTATMFLAAALLLCGLASGHLSGAVSSQRPVTPAVAMVPTTRAVSCDQTNPPPLRLVRGGPGSALCFSGTGVESIGTYVQGVAATGHTGSVFVQSKNQCLQIPFKPNDFLRVDAVVCVLDIDKES
jgi:hypothetical protein